jgi:hypothetical protein
VISVAALTLDLHTSLPRVDRVSVMDVNADGTKAERVAVVSWDRLAAMITLSAEPELAPPRYRCDGVFTPAQLAALRAMN